MMAKPLAVAGKMMRWAALQPEKRQLCARNDLILHYRGALAMLQTHGHVLKADENS